MLATATVERRPSLGAAVGVLLVAVYCVALLWSLARTNFDVWGGLLLLPVLVVVSVPILLRLARTQGDPWLARLYVWGLVAKFAGTFVRYFIVSGVYGFGDADAYHSAGILIGHGFRSFSFAGFSQGGGGGIVGTHFIELVTGFFYTFIPATKVGGYLLFSWLAFWGLYCFYRAFCIAVPDGDHRRYGLLIFFLPTFLFWPSSIGKESWMMFTIGMSLYGTAIVLCQPERRFRGVVLAGIGLFGTSMVRPHVTLMLFLGVALSYLLRKNPDGEALRRMVAKGVGAVLLVAIGIAVGAQAQKFLGLEDLSASSVSNALEYTKGQTSQTAGSTFAPPSLATPQGVAMAAVTILYRPFPNEAGNLQATVASFEGVFLFVLTLFSLRRIAQAFREVRRKPYIVVALVFTVLFVIAFSAFSNFGILTRQRTQLYPFVMVLLCVRPRPTRRERMFAPATAPEMVRA